MASESALAAVVKKAQRKGGMWFEVVDPLSHLGFAAQVSALAQLFADGRLAAKHQKALDAAANRLQLMMSSQENATPRGLTAAVSKLLMSLKTAAADAPGMFPRYSHTLDALVTWAYALDPTPLDRLAESLDGPARLGLESVRHRFGQDVPRELRKALLEGFSRTDGRTLIPGDAGLETADDDELEAIALRLGDKKTWIEALAASAGKAHPFDAWLVTRLDAAQIVRALAPMSDKDLADLDEDTIAALLSHPGSAEAFASAMGEVPDSASVAKTLLGIVTGAKLADASLPIPRPWPLFRSYATWACPLVRRRLVRALLRIHRAFPAERAHAYVRNSLEARFADVLIALAAHPDPVLIESANATIDVDSYPEAQGLLLARLGEKMPAGDDQLRLDYVLCRCEAVPETERDPRWLDVLDLRADLDATAVWPAVWAESRILLAFDRARRFDVILPALQGDGPKGHAIQLIRVLDEELAHECLAAALASASPPPSNWLHWVLREGSLAGVKQPWSHESVLARADAPTMARYRQVMGLEPSPAKREPAPPPARAPSALDALLALSSGPAHIYALEPASAAAPRRVGSRSCLGGNGPVALNAVPRQGKSPMDHVMTIDLADVPEWRERWPEAAAISVFVHDVMHHDGDFSKARIVWISEASLTPDDATSVPVVVPPVSVAERWFAEPGEGRDAIARLGGHALGGPLWIQHDQTPKKRKKAAGFLFQVNPSLAGAHLNLGDEGSLYVFDDGSVVFQCH